MGIFNKETETGQSTLADQNDELILKYNESSQMLKQLFEQKKQLDMQIETITKEKEKAYLLIAQLKNQNQELQNKISELDNQKANNPETQLNDVSKIIMDARLFSDRMIEDAKSEAEHHKMQAVNEAEQFRQETTHQIEEMRKIVRSEFSKMMSFSSVAQNAVSTLKLQCDQTIADLVKMYNQAGFETPTDAGRMK